MMEKPTQLPHTPHHYIFMKHYTTDINTKWAMTYRTYKRATGKRKEVLKEKLQELIILNARINQYNYENKRD